MKRPISILLTVLLILSLCACEIQNDDDYISPIDLYYVRIQDPENLHHGSDNSVIAVHTIEGKGLKEDLAYLLSLYFRGPSDPELESPFPRGTSLVEWSLTDSLLTLTLSDSFATLTGIDLTLACACLTITCLSLTEAEQVQIQAQTVQLDGKQSITMDKSIILLLDDSSTIPTETED